MRRYSINLNPSNQAASVMTQSAWRPIGVGKLPKLVCGLACGLFVLFAGAFTAPDAHASIGNGALMDGPATASVSTSRLVDTPARVSQEIPFFLDPQFDGSTDTAFGGAQGGADPVAAGFSLSLWSFTPVLAVLLLAGFNARKRRNRLSVSVAGEAQVLIRG